MSGILRLESLTKGNTLKQGDKTPLKYSLFDADGEELDIAGKSAKVRLVYPDFLTIGYEKDGLTVAQDDTVTFTIDSVIPSRIYHVEIIVDDKFIFPSRADEAKFTVDKSSLGTESNIIEIIGVDAVVRKAVDLINDDPNLIIDEDKLVGDIISNTGLGSIDEYYQQFSDVIKELSEEKDYHSLPEIAGARGGFDTLGERLNNTTAEINTLRDTKVGDGVLAEMGDLSQTVKTGMTGGSVAVVGEGAVGQVNLANDLKTKLNTTYLNRNISHLVSLSEPHSIVYDGEARSYTIPSGSRIIYGKTSYSLPETITLIDDFSTTAIFMVFNHVEKTLYLKEIVEGVSESEFVLATIRRIDREQKIRYVGVVAIEGSVEVEVGEGVVGEVNLANNLKTKLDTTYLNRNISYLPALTEPHSIVYDGNARSYTIPRGSRISYGNTSYGLPETITLIDDFTTTAISMVFNHIEKTFYLKEIVTGVSDSEIVLASIRRLDNKKIITYAGDVSIEGDVIQTERVDELLSHNLMYSSSAGGDIIVTNPQPTQVKIVIKSQLFLYNLLEGNEDNKRIIFVPQENADSSNRDLPILETGERAEDGSVTFILNHGELLTYSYSDNTIRVRSHYSERNSREVLLAYSINGGLTGGVFRELNNHLRLNEIIEDGGVTNTIQTRNKDVEHIVYAGADYNRSEQYDHFLTFLIGTDFHNDRQRLSNMIDYGNNSPVVDAIFDLGDIMNANFSDNDGTGYSNTIQQSTKPYLMAMGNHDAGNTALVGQSTTPLNMYNKFIAPNENLMELDYTIDTGVTYYYKDFSENKVRTIVLNPYDLPDENDGTTFTINRTVLGFSQSQIDWFISVLSETPSDYHVLIAAHDMIENRIIELDHVFTNPDRQLTPKQVNHGTVISDIVNAWKNGLSISETYPFTTTTSEFSSISATADFTGSSGIFIGYITGDRHVDAVFHLENYPDQRGITFDTSNYSGLWQRYISDLPRAAGTKSEDILTTMSFDIDRRVVNLVRIGANVTRFMKERTFSTFEY